MRVMSITIELGSTNLQSRTSFVPPLFLFSSSHNVILISMFVMSSLPSLSEVWCKFSSSLQTMMALLSVSYVKSYIHLVFHYWGYESVWISFLHLSIILYAPKLMKKDLVSDYWGLLLTFLGIHPKFLAKSSNAPYVSHFLTGELVIIKKSGPHFKSNPASHPNLPIKKWVFCTLTEICMKSWFRPCTLWQLLILAHTFANKQ